MAAGDGRILSLGDRLPRLILFLAAVERATEELGAVEGHGEAMGRSSRL